MEISPEASLDIILSKKRITKSLNSLRECAGWSASLLFANHRRQVFSRKGPFIMICGLKNIVALFVFVAVIAAAAAAATAGL